MIQVGALQALNYLAINNIKMSFIFPIVTLFNPNTTPLQFYQVPQPSFLNNPYQTSIFYHNITQPKEQTPLILTTNFSTQDSLAGPTIQKPLPKKKKPSVRKDSDQTFGWRIQNKDRNIMSNILKAFVNHIYDQIGMRPYIEELFAKLDLQNDVSDFYIFFKHHFSQNSSYISSKYVKNLLRNPQLPPSLLLALRLVLNRFFRVDFALVLMKSTKIKRRSKLEQMKKGRQLLQSLFKE